jgi:hypothetical protein
MSDDLDTRHCTCPRDEHGEIEVWFIEEQDGTRRYFRYYNPNCVRHGWKDRGPVVTPKPKGGS